MDFFSGLFSNVDWYDIWLATLDTLLMLGGSLLFTLLLGLPLGVLLFLTGRSWSTCCARCRSSSC